MPGTNPPRHLVLFSFLCDLSELCGLFYYHKCVVKVSTRNAKRKTCLAVSGLKTLNASPLPSKMSQKTSISNMQP